MCLPLFVLDNMSSKIRSFLVQIIERKNSLLFVSLILLLFVYSGVFGQGNGAVRLVNEQGQSSLDFYTGVLEIYINGVWGSVCRWGNKTTFGKVEADVACYQLGWNGAVDLHFSTNLNGTLAPVISDVQCSSSQLTTLAQCSFKTSILDSRCNNGSSVVPICNSSTIWSNAYSGMIRLQGGNYITEGRIEIYCNGRWGTVCDNGFNKNAANTICRELGYTSALSYIDNTIPAKDAKKPIWLVGVACPFVSKCLSDCHQCPAVENTECFHTDDTTVTCTYNITDEAISSQVFMCKDDSTSLSVGLIVIIVLVLIGLMISLSVGSVLMILILLWCKKKRYYLFAVAGEQLDDEEDFHEIEQGPEEN